LLQPWINTGKIRVFVYILIFNFFSTADEKTEGSGPKCSNSKHYHNSISS
jgi:hypothetical protein